MKNLTIISDCRDEQARARQVIRYQSLLGSATTNFVGVSNDIEASGNLIDVIDAYGNADGIIVSNVAPRGNKEKYQNGIPFCFHRFKNLWIIGTPNCFSLAKKLKLFSKTFKTDVFEVCRKFLSEKEALLIANSQFRSFEYLPYLVKWITEGKDIPKTEIIIENFGYKNFVWCVDCFGDCKTTTISPLAVDPYKSSTKYSYLDVEFYERLADVPKNKLPVLTRGSSGYGSKRFIEIVIQNKSAADILGLKIGSQV